MTPPRTLDEVVAPLQLVVAGLMFGIPSVLGVSLRIGTAVRTSAPSLERILLIAVVIAAAGSAAGVALLQRRFAGDLATRAAELQQVAEPGLVIAQAYRRFVVLRAGLLEAPALFALTSYLITGAWVLLLFPGLSLALLFLSFPTAARLRQIARP